MACNLFANCNIPCGLSDAVLVVWFVIYRARSCSCDVNHSAECLLSVKSDVCFSLQTAEVWNSISACCNLCVLCLLVSGISQVRRVEDRNHNKSSRSDLCELYECKLSVWCSKCFVQTSFKIDMLLFYFDL